MMPLTARRPAGTAPTRLASAIAAAFVFAGGTAGTAAAAPLATLDRNGAFVSVEAYGPNIVHVTIAVDKAEVLKGPGYGIIAQHADNKAFQHRPAADGDTFTSNGMTLRINPAAVPSIPTQSQKYFAPSLAPVGLEVRNAQGQQILKMTGWEMSPQTVNEEKTYQVGAEFHAPADEHYYGMGQNQESLSGLDLRGRTLDCKHWYDAPGGETVCVPFMVSSKGYGIVWDNPSATRFSAGVLGSTRFQSNVGERVSFFIITGKNADELYSGYARLTGKTPIPPKAAFGLIQSKARYDSQDQVLRIAKTYREKRYPLDIMVVDWFYWTRMGQLDIDPAQFPDPEGMNKQLHDMGMQSIISVWPRFETAGRYFNELDAKGYLLKDKDGKTQDGLPFRSDRTGGLIDSTNPAARKWFFEKVRDNVLSRGFDYPWLDETEPDLVPDGFRFSIGTGDRYRNLYPLVHVEGFAEGMRAWKPNRRVLILSRAAYLGSQRTGALFWSSDIKSTWEALARQIPAGLNMTASGIAYWGNDIGGWQNLPQTTEATKAPLLDPSDARNVVGQNHDYPELHTRWFQYGTFTPTLRLHGSRKEAELWSFGKQAEAVMAKFNALRYQLIPYIYSQAKMTHDTGAPFMRPLWMDFGSDPNVANIGTQYMFGPAFLVAPVTEQGQTEKNVYLPAGTDWYNWWTDEKLAGGQWVKVAAPIDQIPVFVKAGSIVPLGAAVQSTAGKQAIEQIRVYPGAGDAEFTLYDDDGLTYDYEKGKGVVSGKLRWKQSDGTLSASGGPSGFAAAAPKMVKVIGR
ncbi:glycoside hydrolase family 31 protein [Pseudoduganella sp. SL102]|uniref:glycoside hydrolase family 31 protein n=1 Tax=Pseudoduganella sp. SL102 TaxID=2995154 RepID=UPI00248BFA7D|nr:glycoside hydrolase family 31 protein [Pseudoduganella sp. SL102]WBS03840.1 glycoside hydrolase family 31 protein [Pseudoduganella sp. SL102]